MKPKTIVAVALIALGLMAFAYQGITYTTRGRDLDIVPMHMTTEQSHRIPVPPIIGALALVGGFTLLLIDTRSINRPATL